MPTETPKYKRVLLKLSGESLSEKGVGIFPEAISSVAGRISSVSRLGVQIGVVVGGGNLVRGTVASQKGIDRVAADYMGMLATVINAIALQDSLEKIGTDTRVLSAITVEELAEPFIRRRAVRHLQKGRIVLFAGGTGNPYFSTDTAAVLRAVEIGAEVVLKATKVDGVYDSDPKKNPDARLYEALSYLEVIKKGLKVMDSTAVALCMENDIPMIVFNLWEQDSIKRAVLGQRVGTLVMGRKK